MTTGAAMTWREKRAARAAYRLRLAERAGRHVEDVLWAGRDAAYQAAIGCTIRRQPGRLEELIRLPTPLRLVEAVGEPLVLA